MKTPMSDSFKIHEKIYMTSQLKTSIRIISVMAILELILAAATAFVEATLGATQSTLVFAIRLGHAILPLIIYIPIALVNKKKRTKLTFFTAMSCILLHCCAALSISIRNIISLNYIQIPWWTIPVIAVAFMSITMFITWKILIKELYTTCELWDADGIRYLFVDQKTAFFPDRKTITCDRIFFLLGQVSLVEMDEAGTALTIRGDAQTPEWNPGKDDLKALSFDATAPARPVKINIIARTENDKKKLALLYGSLQNRILDCP